MPCALNKRALCDCPGAAALAQPRTCWGKGNSSDFKLAPAAFPTLFALPFFRSSPLCRCLGLWMAFMAKGGLGGEAGTEIPGIAPGDATTGWQVEFPQRGNAWEGRTHKQTHPGRHGDKGQPDATGIPQGFLNFHRPKNPTLTRHAQESPGTLH